MTRLPVCRTYVPLCLHFQRLSQVQGRSSEPAIQTCVDALLSQPSSLLYICYTSGHRLAKGRRCHARSLESLRKGERAAAWHLREQPSSARIGGLLRPEHRRGLDSATCTLYALSAITCRSENVVGPPPTRDGRNARMQHARPLDHSGCLARITTIAPVCHSWRGANHGAHHHTVGGDRYPFIPLQRLWRHRVHRLPDVAPHHPPRRTSPPAVAQRISNSRARFWVRRSVDAPCSCWMRTSCRCRQRLG